MGSYPNYGIILLLIFIIPWKLIFLFFLFTRTIFAASASSWFSAWIALEINILSLLALSLREKSPRNSEASLKYFLVQALASAVLIFSVFLRIHQSFFVFFYKELATIISLSLLIKLGASPFHVWLPQVIEGINWLWAFIVLSWQKIAPFILLISSLKKSFLRIFFISIILSARVGALNGISQTSIRKILSFSSINHIGWILSAIIIKLSLWWFYFITYSFILRIVVAAAKIFNLVSISNFWYSISKGSSISIIILLISLGGLPPFLGFAPKWFVITNLINRNYISVRILLVIRSLVTLFFYLRIIFPAILIGSKVSLRFKLTQKIILYFAAINFLGLRIIPYILLT